jgi:hypothetical protein
METSQEDKQEVQPSKLHQATAILSCIRDVLSSSLGRETDYTDRGYDFPHRFLANVRTVP